MLRTLIRLPLLRTNPRVPRGRTLRLLVSAVILLILGREVFHVVGGTNEHEIIPGRVYRTAQLSPGELKTLIATRGIKTVINLRGFCPGDHAPWYAKEIAITHEAGVSQEDVTFSANRLPPPAELQRLIDVLDHTEYPIAFHCKQGADRTGLTATIVLLLYTDATLDQARHQLWPRYGHFRFGRTAAIDDFFDRYETWLNSREHTPSLFRDWMTNHYSPGPAQGTLIVQHSREPFTVAADRWAAIPVRATNHSTESWELRPGNYAGIHVQFTVQNEQGVVVHAGQAGLFRRTVPPGGAIDLTLAVPPLRTPGQYLLRGDLMDATEAGVPIRQTGFYQFGADPLMMFLEVK